VGKVLHEMRVPLRAWLLAIFLLAGLPGLGSRRRLQDVRGIEYQPTRR
jgi:hypothetical protein